MSGSSPEPRRLTSDRSGDVRRSHPADGGTDEPQDEEDNGHDPQDMDGESDAEEEKDEKKGE